MNINELPIFPFTRAFAEGYSVDIADNILTTTFANGSAERRLKSYRINETITAVYPLDKADDRDIATAFYRTVNQGIIPFQWVCPEGIRYLVRLQAPIKISYTRLNHRNFKGEVEVTIQLLEELPNA